MSCTSTHNNKKGKPKRQQLSYKLNETNNTTSLCVEMALQENNAKNYTYENVYSYGL